MYRCNLCDDLFVPSFKLLLVHIAKVHANSSDFNLPCGCETTFTNFHAFKQHLRKKHRFITAGVGDDHTNLEVTGAGDMQMIVQTLFWSLIDNW